MADTTMSLGASRAGFYLARLGLALAVLSVVLLALAPIGWRAGLWHYGKSFWYLMEPAAFIAGGALVVSVVALFFWAGMGGGSRAIAIAGVIAGAVLVYWPVQFYAKIYPLPILGTTPLPRIHDITTDTENPPAFSAAILAARAAEKGSTTDYDPKAGALQKQGYADIAPVKTALPPAEAYKRARAAAQSMSGWRIVTDDPAAGRIEASQSTRFMGFTDDIAIRVAPDGSGSRIDIRSESRQGISDFGVNANRIRSYIGALRQQLA